MLTTVGCMRTLGALQLPGVMLVGRRGSGKSVIYLCVNVNEVYCIFICQIIIINNANSLDNHFACLGCSKPHQLAN